MDAIYGVIRWVRGHVRGFYTAVGLFFVIGLGLAALSAGLFALIAEWMAGGATQTFDQAVVSWMRARPAAWMDWLGVIGAVLGSGMALWVVLGLGTVAFLATRHYYSVLILWVALFGSRLLNQELKTLFDRPRPEPIRWDLTVFGRPIDFPASPSFPSGHAVAAVVIFGTLAYLVVRLEPTVRLRRITLAATALIILLIGLSRVYLGVHYPSDVLAGYLAGFVWATFAAFTIELLRYFRDRKPEVEREEKDLERGMRPLREAVRGEGHA